MTDQELINRILLQGRQYQSALLPKGVTRGPIGKCFDITLLNAMHNRSLRYVEGVAMTYAGTDKLAKLKGRWILHAWLTDGTHAFDPTWRALDPQGNEVAMPTAYVGIEMDTMAVAHFVLTTKYSGVLANADKNPELAREAVGDIV